ncbi:MAG: UDP-N-acetylglucosamine 4,6-dehydratase (inverting) [Candidatus Omnitrophica bacterium]|nr:UDP-N-acetylglucosamine 4,6-dehydratase (inverting) [Candidatus Omnitrophota bacterium]
MLNGKVVLITGGTGSFGKKFTDMVFKRYKPKKLIIFSRDEMKQYEMKQVFSEERHENLRYFIGDVRDRDRLHRAFNGVDIVVHAAALKIVPTAEYNPFEAVKTNILGAENVINIAIDNGVKKVIALSTDKAANPINLYGATKLCAEKMFVAANNYSWKKTQFSVVRYGNVFGSRGSVVPFFKECAKTGIIPITDENMTRFWITLEQGVDLVLDCLKDMDGGEVFIPKLPSIKIIDLAKAIGPKCKIKITGIRPGEKLHETLVPADDGIHTHEYKDKFVTYPRVVSHDIKKGGKYLGLGFEGYRSDNNTSWLTKEEIKSMIKKQGF